jgi:hypothetical protein
MNATTTEREEAEKLEAELVSLRRQSAAIEAERTRKLQPLWERHKEISEALERLYCNADEWDKPAGDDFPSPLCNVRLVLKYNNAAVNGGCPLCGNRTDPGIPFAIFLEGTWDDVCDQCAMQHAPWLVLLIQMWDDDESLFHIDPDEIRQRIKENREAALARHHADGRCPF